MPKGVRNPFNEPPKPKPNFKSAFDEIDTESGQIDKPFITLDGGSFGLVITGVKSADDAAKLLVTMITDISKEHSHFLVRHGVRIGCTVHAGEVILKTAEGSLTVFIGEDVDKKDKEELAFRRIASTLKKLSIKEVLAKYNVRVYERG
jgi:hypothetical protein